MITRLSRLIIFLLICAGGLTMPSALYAQQYGARSFVIAPEGLNVLGVMWEHQDLSLDPTAYETEP